LPFPDGYLVFIAEQVVKTREDWENELIQRQDNIDPIRRIPNGALFTGTLINGGQQWNRVQRFGALLVGIMTLSSGILGLSRIVAAVLLRPVADLGMTIASVFFAPFSLWAGYRIVKNAFINPDKERTLKRQR
jgi:hypothetical protein